MSATNVREAIFNAIPQNLKAAVSVGIGLFIAFIGLQNAKIVIGGSTLLQLFSVDKYNEVNGVSASFNDVGITVLLAIIGIIVTGILVVKNIKGNILWGILITWLLGIICQFTGLYVPKMQILDSIACCQISATDYPFQVCHQSSANWTSAESSP